MTERERLLLDAAAAVRERGESYGDPQAHFAITIGMVNAALGHKLRVPLVTADWPIIMVCDKIAREQHKPKRDNACDMAGYAACLGEIRREDYATENPPKDDPAAIVDLSMSVEHNRAMDRVCGEVASQFAQEFAQAWSRDRRETDAEAP
jgi:hypothetical protein